MPEDSPDLQLPARVWDLGFFGGFRVQGLGFRVRAWVLRLENFEAERLRGSAKPSSRGGAFLGFYDLGFWGLGV